MYISANQTICTVYDQISTASECMWYSHYCVGWCQWWHNGGSAVERFMLSHGYIQLVRQATTDRSTLIHLIYFNKQCDDVYVQVCDVYYSDHDAVYCSVMLSILWVIIVKCVYTMTRQSNLKLSGKQLKNLNLNSVFFLSHMYHFF